MIIRKIVTSFHLLSYFFVLEIIIFENSIGLNKPGKIMDRKPDKCHPHYCAFDSPACPEQCGSACNKIKPNCVSVTAQEALNIPVRRLLVIIRR